MKIRTVVTAIGTAIAIAGTVAAHGGQTETVAPKFDQAIPNIPGKSLVAVEVDYAPGPLPRRTPMRSPPSSTPMSSRVRLNRR